MASSSIWALKSFYLSADVDLDFKIYLGSFQQRSNNTTELVDSYVSLQLICGGVPLHPFARSTQIGVVQDSRVYWNEWIALPIKIRDIPQTAQLVFKVWSANKNECIAGATIRCFDHKLALRRGLQPVSFWRANLTDEDIERLAHRSILTSFGNTVLDTASSAPLSLLLTLDDVTMHIKALERHISGEDGPASPWVDRLALAQSQKEIMRGLISQHAAACANGDDHEELKLLESRFLSSTTSSSSSSTSSVNFTSNSKVSDILLLGTLGIHFPIFHEPILFSDVIYEQNSVRMYEPIPPLLFTLTNSSMAAASSSATAAATNASSALLSSSSSAVSANTSNPASIGASSSSSSSSPSITSLIGDESSLPSNSHSILQTPEVAAASAAAAAIQQRGYWSEQVCSIHDAEELAAQENPSDSKYHKLARAGLKNGAVDISLKPDRSDQTKLQAIINARDYLLKLDPETQELIWRFRYSLLSNKKACVRFIDAVDWTDEEEAKEGAMLLQRWTPIDADDALTLLLPNHTSTTVRAFAIQALKRAADDELSLYLLQLVQALRYEPQLSTVTWIVPSSVVSSPSPDSLGGIVSPASPSSSELPSLIDSFSQRKTNVFSSPLASFLIERSSSSLELGIYLHWYLRVGADDQKLGPLFGSVHEVFLHGLSKSAIGVAIADTVRSQENFLRRIGGAISEATSSKRDRVEAKIEKLNKLLLFDGPYNDIASMSSPISMPLNPAILINGIVPRGAHMFRSALYPTVVTLRVHPESVIDWAAPVTICGLTIHEAAVRAAQGILTVSAIGSGTSGVSEEAGLLNVDTITHDMTISSSSSNLPFSPIAQVAVAAVAGAAATVVATAERLRGGGGGGGGGGGINTVTSTSSSPGPSPMKRKLRFQSRGAVGGGGGGGNGSPSNKWSMHSVGAEVAEAVAEAMEKVAGEGLAPSQGQSNNSPLAPPPATYRVILKTGDDMRQDQLVIQLIRLMDKQLKRVGLDLKLTPYSVLATSMNTGVMEMVLDSAPISYIVEKYRGNTIQTFFKEKHPSNLPGNEFGIEAEVMDTYIKSCAGYCVATYLLGVGDRHLDNIMLRSDGYLFHIDFGFIFGKDPKPMPAPIRLTKEMIDGMGGPQSANYSRFKTLTCQAYNILRRHATLFTTLATLMSDAGIEDLHPDPQTVIMKMHEKFRVDIDDEAADAVLLRIIDDSVAAMFPQFLEVLHKIRVAFR
jgi:hypothetical protein